MKLARKLILSFFIVSFLYPFSQTEAQNSKKPSAKICAEALRAVSWEARSETLEDRLKILISLLDRHPNIITANLEFKRSLVDAYVHVPELRRKLGAEAASFETTSPSVRRARYVASGEAQYNEEAVKAFLKDRVADVQALDLVDGGDFGTQIRHLKQSSKRADGSFDEKAFTRKVRRLLQVMPLLFDAHGQALFKAWASGQENTIKRITEMTPAEIETRYGDLLKEHLSHVVDQVAAEKGMGQVKVLFESMRNQFLEKEVRPALTPVSSEGTAVQERTLSIESLPAWASIARGCYGGDCSILSVPYYSLIEGVKVHFIRKGGDLSEQPIGYAFSVPVQVNGKTVPYVLTINGVTLTQVDIEMAVNLIASDYGSPEVVLPDFQKRHGVDHWNSNLALVNTDVARKGMAASRRKRVEVQLPAGWGIVDAYMRVHQVKEYRNYYAGDRIRDAYLSSVSRRDPRLLEPIQADESHEPQYEQVKDLLGLPLLQRSILGVQALKDSEQQQKSGVRAASYQEVLDALGLKGPEVEAARPFVELSSQRALTLEEYRLAEKELGLELQNLLDLESGARAASLRSLYQTDPSLFSKHQIRNNGKGITALIEAYGPAFPEEIRTILKAKDLSDEQVLKILQNLKPSLKHGDLSKALVFQNYFKGTSLEAWALTATAQAFVRMNPAETALGRKLDAALSSKDRDERSFALAALHESSSKTSPMFQAFQEISKRMEEESLSYNQAVQSWLTGTDGSIHAKARYLGMFLNSSRFQELLNKTPEREREEILEAIDDFSSYFLFERLARGEVSRPQAGVLRRILGRGKTSPSRSLPSNLILESFEFVDAPIPEGGVTFTLGSPSTEADRGANESLTEVTLTRPFQMQATPVSQWQYKMVMGKNPSHFTQGGESINRPGEQISWKEAVAMAERMSELDPNWNYRLSTEAEWEFMARAGTRTAYSFGNDPSELRDYAHYHENAGSQTHPVTAKRPNPWGLYDMHGNVWEWQQDWYGESYLGGVDPQGPESGSSRVLRGGSWYIIAQYLRSAQRRDDHPGDRNVDVGFRLVRTPK